MIGERFVNYTRTGGVLLLRGLVPHYMPWSLGIEISVIEMHKIVAESFSRSVLGS